MGNTSVSPLTDVTVSFCYLEGGRTECIRIRQLADGIVLHSNEFKSASYGSKHHVKTHAEGTSRRPTNIEMINNYFGEKRATADAGTSTLGDQVQLEQAGVHVLRYNTFARSNVGDGSPENCLDVKCHNTTRVDIFRNLFHESNHGKMIIVHGGGAGVVDVRESKFVGPGVVTFGRKPSMNTKVRGSFIDCVHEQGGNAEQVYMGGSDDVLFRGSQFDGGSFRVKTDARGVRIEDCVAPGMNLSVESGGDVTCTNSPDLCN